MSDRFRWQENGASELIPSGKGCWTGGCLHLRHALLHLSMTGLLLGALVVPVNAQPAPSPGMPRRLWEVLKALNDAHAAGSKAVMRYGNWLGPGWWGGSERSDRVGMMPPIDDLDATARKHDFGYQIAEELGHGRPGVEGMYMAIADLIAIRDTMALDRNPTRWRHPAKDPVEAQKYMQRLIISFEEFQVRYNQFRSAELGRADITDLDVLNQVLDGLPDVAKFEQMQLQRVKEWEQRYADWKAQKSQHINQQSPKPGSTSVDCTKGGPLDRALCGHDPKRDRLPSP